jgi:hypothetical protein
MCAARVQMSEWWPPSYMCPAAAPNAGTGRDHMEREGTGKVNGLAMMKGDSASRLE